MPSHFAAAHRQLLKAQQSLLQAAGSIINKLIFKMSKSEDARFSEEELEEELPFVQEILEPLASGGFGTVLLGRHKVNQIPIVVKISHMKDDEEENAELEDVFRTERDFYEANVGRSDISWLPKYYGSGVLMHRGVKCPWIALEHLHSCLWSLNTKGQASNQFRHLALGALKALECLHAEGYVHRDIKLENIALRKDAVSGELEVCLIDFGLLFWYYTIESEGENDSLPYVGTLEYSSDRQLQERMIGPADDLISLGYCILELYMGVSWWNVDRNSRKIKVLKKFAEENQANILPSRHRKKRGRDANHAQHGQQEAQQLPLPSANDRPRNQARCEEDKSAEEDEPVFAARLVLAPAPAPGAASPSAVAATSGTSQDAIVPAASRGETTQNPIMTLGEKCLRTIKRRKKVWSRLDKQGKIPSFLKEWMKYCKSLTAYECPDYDKLRSLLETAPKIAHIAEALYAKQPIALENEE
ncbi:hypothetical protein Ndes2526B_g01106 [Nannochloris sp. 'desiccata']